MPMPKRGLFIVIEGLDRSGKSTQVTRLVDALRRDGANARVQKFPDRETAIGQMIDGYLRSKQDLDDKAIHLLFSANRWESSKKMEKDIESGMTIVADRYAFSGIAFSAAKGLDFDFCLNPDTGLPLPDLTIYLHVTPEAASARAAFGQERYETVAMQNRVREKFSLVEERVKTVHGESVWVRLDASKSIEEVGGEIWSLVSGLEHRRDDPLSGHLWQASVR